MYLEYWGFKIFPFENVPDPEFFYLSKSHEEALTRLIYAVKMRKGGAILSGEIGCGKTTLSKVYVQRFSGGADIGLIINPRMESKEFIEEILYRFGITGIPDTKTECLRALSERMIDNLRRNRETLLIVDEAQLLDDSTFEEIRLLLNFQADNRFLITIILLGQPELRQRIKGIEQLDQRFPIKYHLTPFNLEDTYRYILFRQRKAGRKENLFQRGAIERIFEYTGGVPRKINNLCDLSLLMGFSTNERAVTRKIIEEIISDGTLF